MATIKSIEEKARAYDIALDKIKRLLGSGSNCSREELEYVFSELAESDDEKIRRELIRFVKGCFPDGTSEQRKAYLAWLEKQGNNMGISEATKKKLEDNLNKALEKETPESWNKFLDEQGEQKEYTFKSLPRLLDMIEPTDRAKAYCQKLIDTLIKEGYATDAKIVGECLKKMNGEDVPLAIMDEKQGEQKIAPKFKVGDTVKDPYGDLYHITEITDDSYKTDDGRFILFKNQEVYTLSNLTVWSEEDENRFTNLIFLVKCSKENDATKEGFIKFINKLKSFRHQKQWKPSDELIRVIEAVINNQSFQRRHLDSLYEQLKKLREE